MFDYFKNMKKMQYEKPYVKSDAKPKKDKVFIAILIVFGVIIAVSLVIVVGNLNGGATQNMNYKFKFSISDGIVLGGITLAYIITRIRKGRK